MDSYTIYRIYNDTATYIGKTINYRTRMTGHKSNCTNPNSKAHNLSVYKYIRENGGWHNFDSEILAEQECSRRDSAQLEGDWLNFYNNDTLTLNKQKPGRSHNDSQKAYYRANIDKINEKHRCDCGGRYTMTNKSVHLKSKKHRKWQEMG